MNLAPIIFKNHSFRINDYRVYFCPVEKLANVNEEEVSILDFKHDDSIAEEFLKDLWMNKNYSLEEVIPPAICDNAKLHSWFCGVRKTIINNNYGPEYGCYTKMAYLGEKENMSFSKICTSCGKTIPKVYARCPHCGGIS